MIYRDNRHQRTFEKEAAMRPESISRPLLAGLYLLTADGNLWNQVKDQISLRRVYVDDMRPKNLTGTSYVFFAAAKDILSGSHTVQLTEIADPALLSMKSYLILCTALAIRAYGVEKASRIQSSKGGRRVCGIHLDRRWPGWFCYRFLPISSSHFWLKQMLPFST